MTLPEHTGDTETPYPDPHLNGRLTKLAARLGVPVSAEAGKAELAVMNSHTGSPTQLHAGIV